MSGRSAGDRIAAALRRLESEPGVWIATASADGRPHLIPLSLAWDGERILLATPSDSPTVRNVEATGRARVALESTADVVVADTRAEAVPITEADAALVRTYVDRVGWDPRDETDACSLLILTPRLAHAWNSEAEIVGRTIMRAGAWTA